MEMCLLQIEPIGTTNFLPRCCWDLRTQHEIQLFQLGRLAQCFKQICGALCSFRVSVEAPAVFCQKMSETICRKHLETAISAGIQSILNTYMSTWTHRTTSQIYTNLNSDNIQQRQINTRRKQEKPSTISLCEVLMEICRLQVKPLGTTNFLPRCCWDLITEAKIQVFQLCRLAQGFKQICGALCSFRVFVEAPAVFCQKQSVKNTLRQR